MQCIPLISKFEHEKRIHWRNRLLHRNHLFDTASETSQIMAQVPSEGGKPCVLARFNGGQGTINVPLWAPDSRLWLSWAISRRPRGFDAKIRQTSGGARMK